MFSTPIGIPQLTKLYKIKLGDSMDKIFLATPGPVNIPEEVIATMHSVFYHRNQDFANICISVSQMLAQFFTCPNPPIMLAASGTGAMEAAITNLLSPGDKIICIECGKFSERFANIAKAFACEVIQISAPYGKSPDPSLLEKALATHPNVRVVTACYSETSTCILNPITEYAKILAQHEAVFVVDAISAAGVMSIDQENLKIDLCIGAGHKGFMTFPVIAFISYYGNKIEKAFKKSNLPKFYFNLPKEIETQKTGLSLWTPPINTILGLKKSLEMMLEEGIENIFFRHKSLSEYTLDRGKSLGLQTIVEAPELPSRAVSGFYTKNPKEIIDKMKEKKILIAGGQGSLSSTLIRIGHMGRTSLDDMKWIMDTLEKCI